MANLPLRERTLYNYQANPEQVKELLAYNQNVFTFTQLDKLPLPSESHIQAWQEYAEKAQKIGIYEALKIPLVQLNFPIVEGISQTEEYRLATQKGSPVKKLSSATGLSLTEPEKLELEIYPTLAGEIPVIIAGNRADFVSLMQALTKKNEPQEISDSIGSCIIGGYNNWDRIRQYRDKWLGQNPGESGKWALEFKNLIPQKHLYQDRFIILSPGFYSNIPPQQLELTKEEWQDFSRQIRLEHECTHYFTRRFFGSMRNNLLDEIISDYQGMVKTIFHYRSDWFLHFMGLENFPEYRAGARLENYRGEPPLSPGAFKILQALVKAAAENLENFHQSFYAKEPINVNNQVAILVALTTLTLEELACDEAIAILESAVSAQKQSITVLG